VGWTSLPRDYLEKQFDSLGLEHNFETGITDTAQNVEKLSDYPDVEEDGRCPSSLEVVTPEDEIVRVNPSGLVVRCHLCGQTVPTSRRKGPNTWAKPTHHIRT